MQTTVVSVRYDSVQGLYHGRVDVERDGRTFRYPCRVEAPLSASRDLVERALARQALRMSQSDQPVPRVRPARSPAQPGLGRRIAEAWGRMLHPLNVRDAIRVRADDPRRPRTRLY